MPVADLHAFFDLASGNLVPSPQPNYHGTNLAVNMFAVWKWPACKIGPWNRDMQHPSPRATAECCITAADYQIKPGHARAPLARGRMNISAPRYQALA